MNDKLKTLTETRNLYTFALGRAGQVVAHFNVFKFKLRSQVIFTIISWIINIHMRKCEIENYSRFPGVRFMRVIVELKLDNFHHNCHCHGADYRSWSDQLKMSWGENSPGAGVWGLSGGKWDNWFAPTTSYASLQHIIIIIIILYKIAQYIISLEGALIAIAPYDYPRQASHFLRTHQSSITT